MLFFTRFDLRVIAAEKGSRFFSGQIKFNQTNISSQGFCGRFTHFKFVLNSGSLDSQTKKSILDGYLFRTSRHKVVEGVS